MIALDITSTPRGPKEWHETYYSANTYDNVSAVVVIPLDCHTIDWPSLDKVTDSADEVRVNTKAETNLTFIEPD